MNLIQKVEELTVNYGNESQRVIGNFILKERAKLHRYSIQEIANQTFTSKASLVRFAKKLGFSGWREFIKVFVEEERYQESHYSDIDSNYPFQKESSTRDIIQKISSLQVESILDTADLIDEQVINKIIMLLKNCSRIALFGTNPNNLMGELFSRKMLSIGRVVEIPSYGNVKMFAKTLTEKDCAIIISYSGNNYTYDPVLVSSILHNRNIPIIAITSAGENNLRQNATYTITIFSQERIYSKISTFGTETSIMYILNVIFAAYFAMDYDNNIKKKIEISEEFELNRISYLPGVSEEKKN